MCLRKSIGESLSVSYRPSRWLNRIVFDFRNRSRKYSSQGISRNERRACSIWRRHIQERATQTLRRTEAVTSRSSSNVPVDSERSRKLDCSRGNLPRILWKSEENNLDNFIFHQFHFPYLIFFIKIYEDDAHFICTCNAFKYIVIVTRDIIYFLKFACS